MKQTLSFIVFISIILVLSPHHARARAPMAIPAKAAVVMDASGTVLYSKFPTAKLAPASTVKLVTAMVTLDKMHPDEVVQVSAGASRVRTVPPGLCPEEEMTVSGLLHLALMRSINSAAVALAESVAGTEDAFVDIMNQKAAEIGAKATLFSNASGLPKGIQYSTANDLALIMKAANGYPLIREILATKEYTVRTTAGREIVLDNSNQLLYEEQYAIIGKTGYTGNARHCFVAAIDTDNGPLFTVILGARKRPQLWRITQMLAEIGKHPELARSFAHSRDRGEYRKASAGKGRAPSSGTVIRPDVADLQMSRIQGVFPQLLQNN